MCVIEELLKKKAQVRDKTAETKSARQSAPRTPAIEPRVLSLPPLAAANVLHRSVVQQSVVVVSVMPIKVKTVLDLTQSAARLQSANQVDGMDAFDEVE